MDGGGGGGEGVTSDRVQPLANRECLKEMMARVGRDLHPDAPGFWRCTGHREMRRQQPSTFTTEQVTGCSLHCLSVRLGGTGTHLHSLWM